MAVCNHRVVDTYLNLWVKVSFFFLFMSLILKRFPNINVVCVALVILFLIDVFPLWTVLGSPLDYRVTICCSGVVDRRD